MGAVSILYVPCLIMLRGVYDGKVSLIICVPKVGGKSGWKDKLS